MPAFFGSGQVSWLSLTFPSDPVIPSGKRLHVDTITETTASHGVEVDVKFGSNASGQILSLGGA